MKITQLITVKSKAFLAEIIPAGTSRAAVRGFLASKVLSKYRLKAMAAFRAVTMHTSMRTKVSTLKGCSLGSKKNAKAKPIKAKGKAKMVWLNFTRAKYFFKIDGQIKG